MNFGETKQIAVPEIFTKQKRLIMKMGEVEQKFLKQRQLIFQVEIYQSYETRLICFVIYINYIKALWYEYG